MNALTAIKQPDDALSRTVTDFSIAPSVQSPRLLERTFCAEVSQQFLPEAEQRPVQALEYKSFMRFKIAKILGDMCSNQPQSLLLNTLLSCDEGALLIDAVEIGNVAQADEIGENCHRRGATNRAFQLRRHERPVLRPLCGEKRRQLRQLSAPAPSRAGAA